MLADQLLSRLALMISVVSWWLGWGWEIGRSGWPYTPALHTCLTHLPGSWSTFSLGRKADDWSGLVYIAVVTLQRHHEHRDT